MTDTPPPERPLTDQALARLRKLAEGNGLAPDKIELIESEEKIYTLDGITQLVPFCEHSNAIYPGPVKGQDRTMVPDTASLEAAAALHHKNFLEGRDWVAVAIKDLEEAPGQGWGLEGAKISLPEKSVILAASEICTSCQGRKLITCGQCMGRGFNDCNYCQGRGLEFCYNCNGQGVNPHQPDQPCVVCHGKRQIPCRWCKLTGKLPCPTCQGRGGTACPSCNGNGRITTEIGLACGATINFRFTGKELPSGLRRGVDRLGVANLIKGHADVKLLPKEKKPEEEEKKEYQNPNAPPKPAEPIAIKYQAVMPYADLKLRFGDGRGVLVNVFGKRGSLMGVPAFLDESLKPWREKLAKAAKSGGPLDDALKARAMRDALTLLLGGKGDPTNLRRMYSVGLTAKTAQEIMINMRRAMRKFTKNMRLMTVVGEGLLASAFLAAFMVLPIHASLTHQWPWQAGMILDLAVLAGVMTGTWFGLGSSVRFQLKRHFPDLKISLHGHAGPIGMSMLSGIFCAWAAAIFFAKTRPDWVVHFLSGH